MANLLGGRLVFNAQDKHWYLYEMTGTQDSAKGPEAVHADQHASQGYGFAVWGTDEAGKVEQGLNWKPVQSHFYASYHFGRLGYYARVSNTTLSNYNINYVSDTNSTINKANITGVTGISADNKSYDGTTTATINSSAATFSGKVSGDNLILTGGTGGFASKNAANNIVVNVTNLTLGGTDAGNYNLVGGTVSYNGTANITPKNVSVSSIAVNNKSYDGTNSAVVNYSSAVMTGIVSGDQVNITSATAVYADSSIGTNKSVLISNIQLGGADSSNYKLVSSNFSAVSSIINNTSTATTNTTVGLTLSDDMLQKYTATVISRINKIEFTQPAYTYLHTVKQNSDYLQVDYIERGVNITVSGR